MTTNSSDIYKSKLSDVINDSDSIKTYDDIKQVITEARHYSEQVQFQKNSNLTDEHSERILQLLLKLGTALRKIDQIQLDVNVCRFEIKEKLLHINDKLKSLWLKADYVE